MAVSKQNEVRTVWWARPLGHVLWVAMNILAFTIRCRIHYGSDEVKDLVHNKQFIVALWHNRTLTPCYVYKYKMRYPRPMCMITSASKHGALLSTVAEDYGMSTVRGSTHRRGVEGFLGMLRALKKGNSMCVAPDGPRGPAYRAKPGVVKLASMSGLPLIPLCINFSKIFRLKKAWDRYIIPLPFSRIDYCWGKPVRVPRDLTPEEQNRYLEELNQALAKGYPDFEDIKITD